ncbi:Nucleotidyltransferase domain protein [uncultured archaeon]|nr:Nucleotidyltransferase domain protein [uncultured archaeon]
MIKKEHQLLVPFIGSPWKSFTFKEIKELCKKSSKSYVFAVLKKLVKEEILREEKAGNVILYISNLCSLKAQAYSALVAEHLAWNRALPYQNLQKAAEKVPTPFYIFIVTGSYAKNAQKKGSDIDVVVIIDDAEEAKSIYAQLRFTCELSVPEIHLYVFRKSEFLEMLLSKQANYGKEIAKNNLILHGAEAYYQIINEALERGFNDKNLS